MNLLINEILLLDLCSYGHGRIIISFRIMSITISNCEEICKAPTNHSKSKMLYTFSRESRFPRRRQILCDKFYDCRENKLSRTTTMGFGTKYDFTKDSATSPPPNTYTLQNQFQNNPKKGFGFGESRSEMEITGPLMACKRNKNPGPGSYDLKSALNNSSFTITGKRTIDDKQKLKVPGPGTYPVTFCLSDKGRYFLAKYKNCCVRNFSKLEHIEKNLPKTPGPGSYNTDKTDLSPDGRYVFSKMHNSFVRKFGTSHRTELAENKVTPGPGNYKLPSQFGHYIAKNFEDKMTPREKKPLQEIHLKKNQL